MGNIIEKLFGRKKQEGPAVDKESETIPVEKKDKTLPINNDILDSELLATLLTQSEYPHLVVGCAQSVGLQRVHNEDAQFTLTANITNNADNTLLGLYIVADGMGGHKHGELASEIAVRSIGSLILNKIFVPLLMEHPSPPEESLQEIMQTSVIEAHNAIVKKAPGGGTTLTAILIVGERAIIAHVGDSRAYSLSANGDIETLTRDHSLVMRMMELGQLSPDEAAIHPQRNVLYRALGQGEPFDPDLKTFPLPGGGHILLCSDGLWGVVPEQDITRIIISTPDPQQACNKLVNAANAAGGPDNITAILIRLPD